MPAGDGQAGPRRRPQQPPQARAGLAVSTPLPHRPLRPLLVREHASSPVHTWCFARESARSTVTGGDGDRATIADCELSAHQKALIPMA